MLNWYWWILCFQCRHGVRSLAFVGLNADCGAAEHFSEFFSAGGARGFTVVCYCAVFWDRESGWPTVGAGGFSFEKFFCFLVFSAWYSSVRQMQ